jgi:hypothetical protein
MNLLTISSLLFAGSSMASMYESQQQQQQGGPFPQERSANIWPCDSNGAGQERANFPPQFQMPPVPFPPPQVIQCPPCPSFPMPFPPQQPEGPPAECMRSVPPFFPQPPPASQAPNITIIPFPIPVPQPAPIEPPQQPPQITIPVPQQPCQPQPPIEQRAIAPATSIPMIPICAQPQYLPLPQERIGAGGSIARGKEDLEGEAVGGVEFQEGFPGKRCKKRCRRGGLCKRRRWQ